MKALRCPFLTTIPMTHLRRFAPQVLPYAQQCPIMGHALKYSSLADSGEGSASNAANPKGPKDQDGAKKCPFLEANVHVTTPTSTAPEQDIINVATAKMEVDGFTREQAVSAIAKCPHLAGVQKQPDAAPQGLPPTHPAVNQATGKAYIHSVQCFSVPPPCLIPRPEPPDQCHYQNNHQLTFYIRDVSGKTATKVGDGSRAQRS